MQNKKQKIELDYYFCFEKKRQMSDATWEKIYDKIIVELKTNLVYVLVIILTYSLYKSEQSKTGLERSESERLAKDRDEWRNLAAKAIKRNFNYVDILIHNYDKNTISTDSLADTSGR